MIIRKFNIFLFRAAVNVQVVNCTIYLYIKNAFIVNDLTIYCNLSRKAISKEFDMLKAKFLSCESILLKLAITQLNIEINYDAVTPSFLRGCIFVQVNLNDF